MSTRHHCKAFLAYVESILVEWQGNIGSWHSFTELVFFNRSETSDQLRRGREWGKKYLALPPSVFAFFTPPGKKSFSLFDHPMLWNSTWIFLWLNCHILSLGTSSPWGSILPTSSLSHGRYDEENCRCHWRSRGKCFCKLPCNMAEYGWTSCGPENSHRILHVTLAEHKKIWILWEIVEQRSQVSLGLVTLLVWLWEDIVFKAF